MSIHHAEGLSSVPDSRRKLTDSGEQQDQRARVSHVHRFTPDMSCRRTEGQADRQVHTHIHTYTCDPERERETLAGMTSESQFESEREMTDARARARD